MVKGFIFGIISFVVCFSSANAQTRVIKGEYLLSGGIGAQSAKGYRLFKSNKDQLNAAGLSELAVVELDPNDKTCEEIISSGQASHCEPNLYVEASVVSNDPMADSLYGLKQINAASAWDKTTGSDSVVVAVIDTGVDYSHPDLAENIWVNPGEIAGNGIDDDANGWIDDIHGINSLAGTGNPYDDNGHGTHVSGTIGARGNNAVGLTGINWNVKIIGLKFLSASGGGSIFGAIQAIDYMIDLKKRYGLNLKISNNSWGGPGFSQSLHDAIARANNAGIAFVAAAGNEGNNNDYLAAYPANYDLPNVLSVAAVDSDRELTFFSNFGQSVDLAAPGMSILSTLPGARYGSLSGTSMATPHVSGALGLLLASNQALSHIDLINTCRATVSKQSSLDGIIELAGILNVGAMLGSNPIPVTGNVSVKKISLTNARKSKELRIGDKLKLSVVADGAEQSVVLPISVKINNSSCSNTKSLAISGGKNRFNAKVSGLSSAVKRISFAIGEKNISKRIIQNSSSRSVRAKLSTRSLATACSRIVNSIS